MYENELLKGNQREVYNSQEIISALKDYLDVALLTKIQANEPSTKPDQQFNRNQDFWNLAIDDKLFAGQVVSLNNFNLLEWIPASPGLYFTREAIRKREKSLYNRMEREKNNFVFKFLPQYKKIIELIPDEKLGMIQGGYGSLRIAPKIINNEIQYISCATSNGVSHEGIPISLKGIHYNKIVNEIKMGNSPVVNIVGRLMILPKELSPINLRYYQEVPKFYLDVIDLDIIRISPSNDSIISIAITYASRKEYFEQNRFSYSFCSFHPSRNRVELNHATEWLEGYAKRYSNDSQPIIIGDFDEQFDHFNNVEFPLKDIANGRISLEKLQYFSKFFHFQINELTMGDKNTFNNSQIGAVGSNATASNNTFQQVNNIIPNNFDFEQLSQQLSSLRASLTSKAKSPEEFKAIGEVAGAEIASQEKDGNKVLKHLKDAGKWVFDTAKDIGVDIVTDLIKKQVGI